MSQHALNCPKCQGEMVQGYLLDFSAATVLVSQWVEGQPEKSWTGQLKVPTEYSSSSVLPIPKYSTIPVGTFRCKSCGYLEAYARDDFAPK
jgi:hypothetical protein